MLRDRIVLVEEVPWPGQRVEEAVGDPPGVPALAEHQALDAEVERRLADPQRHLAHLLVGADEHREVGGLRGVGADRPADAGLVEDLGVADQPVDMRLGEEVGARRDQQDLGALLVERQPHLDPGLFLDVLLQPLQRVGQRRLRQAEVVADLVDLADDLVAVLLALADVVHDLARGHRDLGGVDAVGAVDRAAPALRALVEVAVPVVQHLLGQVLGADQPRQPLAGQGEVAPVDLAHQVLARHRHVLGIAGAEEVVALVGAGAAAHAGIEVDLQGARFLQQFAEPRDRLVVPVLDQLAREAERLLVLGRGHVGVRMRHRTVLQRRDLRDFGEFGDFVVAHATCSPSRASPPTAPGAASRARCRPGCGSG